MTNNIKINKRIPGAKPQRPQSTTTNIHKETAADCPLNNNDTPPQATITSQRLVNRRIREPLCVADKKHSRTKNTRRGGNSQQASLWCSCFALLIPTCWLLQDRHIIVLMRRLHLILHLMGGLRLAQKCV